MSAIDINDILRHVDEQRAIRARDLPTEQHCIHMMMQCRQRLLELGWHSGEYAPGEPARFIGVNAGFAGPATYQSIGKGFFIEDSHDLYPAPRPLVFKPLDQGTKS